MNAAASPDSSPAASPADSPDLPEGTHLVYLGIGSNIQPERYLPQGLALLRQKLPVIQVSTAWESPSFGFPGPSFLNAAILARTHLAVPELKAQILRPIESALGRVRTSDKNAPRTMDLDVLIFDGAPLDPDIWRCPFLAVPLSELIPDLPDPATGETILHAAARLRATNIISPHPELFIE